MAENMAVDPITLRTANLLPPHCRTITGFRITSNGMRMPLGASAVEVWLGSEIQATPLGQGHRCGVAASLSRVLWTSIHWDPNRFPHATVHLQVDMDGGVTVHTGAADIGQGSTTAVAQVVAEVLALPLDMIHVRSHESDTAPVDLGSYSSRVTFMNANAAIRAALDVRGRLLDAAHAILGIHPDALVLNDRRIYAKFDPSVGVSYLQALHKAQEDRGALIASGAYRSPMGGVHGAAGLAPAYSFSAYVAEVDVDVETGLIRCTNVWAAHDCGKALNPLAVGVLIIGSCHMGLGQVLSEQMVSQAQGTYRMRISSITRSGVHGSEGRADHHPNPAIPEGPFAGQGGG